MTIGRIPSVEGGIQPTIFDAKADILTATAADTPTRLAVGSNNQQLIADSSTTTGLKWVGYRGCSVFTSANGTATTSGAYTVINFNSELFDTDGFHSTTTNTSRMTIPTGLGGKYLVTASIWFDLNGTGNRQLQIFKNGSVVVEAASAIGSASAYTGATWSGVLDLVAGDYLEIYAYQNSGLTINVYARESVKPFTITYLGA